MRRISQWEKRRGAVFGKALQDLGLDCFAVYCTAYVRHIPGSSHEPDTWHLTLERAGFAPQYFKAYRRHDAMMRAEHEIAKQWSEYGIRALVLGNPAAFREMKPGPIPCTDCKAFPFWKPKRGIGPVPEPRYMQLLTPEAIVAAKMPMGQAFKAYFGNPADEPDPELRKMMEEIQEATWERASGEE